MPPIGGQIGRPETPTAHHGIQAVLIGGQIGSPNKFPAPGCSGFLLKSDDFKQSP
jgi:hypothetical protein